MDTALTHLYFPVNILPSGADSKGESSTKKYIVALVLSDIRGFYIILTKRT